MKSPLSLRIILFALVFGSLPLLARPAHAESFLNYLFPSIFGQPERGPKPQDTLIAPFAQGETPRKLTDAERKALTSPENTIPVSQPHRSSKYIGEWASESVAQAFTFDSLSLDAHMGKLDTWFIPYGKQEFMAALQKDGLLESLRQQQQQIKAFIKTEPQLLNEGNFDGVYRWLYDVPVTISIMPSTMTTYAGRNKVTPITRNMVVRVQIGRTSSGFSDGIAIERWTVLGAS